MGFADRAWERLSSHILDHVTILFLAVAAGGFVLLLADVGRSAVMRLPERVHLVPTTASDHELVRAYANSLMRLGFREAGTFRVVEMPGPVVSQLVNVEERARAGILLHPIAGVSVEIISHFVDDTVLSASNRRGGWLPAPPWSIEVKRRGASVDALWSAFLAARPKKVAHLVSVEAAPRNFEAGWARILAWRRAQRNGLRTTFAALRYPVLPQTRWDADRMVSREVEMGSGQLSVAPEHGSEGALSGCEPPSGLAVASIAPGGDAAEQQPASIASPLFGPHQEERSPRSPDPPGEFGD